MAHHLLLDTSSLMYRSFFALPASIRDESGRPVNALYGYLDTTARLWETHRPDRLTHVFDDAITPKARVDAWPSYKAHRAPDPEGLPEQFDRLPELLDALGAEQARAEGWEADDAIGSLCRQARSEDEVEIVTGDRDLLQLVRDAAPAVRVLFTVKGVSELARFDEAAVLAKYGVSAAQYADFATLRGDPSDGLPGVRGIGEKTARKLMEEHGSLAEIEAAAAAGLPGKLGEALRGAEAYLEAMKRVVPVRDDVAVAIRRGEADPEELMRLASSGRLGGPVRRLAGVLGIELSPGN